MTGSLSHLKDVRKPPHLLSMGPPQPPELVASPALCLPRGLPQRCASERCRGQGRRQRSPDFLPDFHPINMSAWLTWGNMASSRLRAGRAFASTLFVFIVFLWL